MEKTFISQYRNVSDKEGIDIDIMDFLHGIKIGSWQDQVLQIRNIKDKKDRQDKKKSCPLVTISGSFSDRKDNALRKHSGLIAIDIDNIDNAETVKDVIKNDPYIFAAFVSISGSGLCLLIKIDGTRHKDAFDGLCKYLYDQYQIQVDRSGSNLSRARFISYDPHLILNEKSQTFKKYLPKEKQREIPNIVFVQTDFDQMINEMVKRGVNCCEDYQDWIRIGFGLVNQFKDQGREYFHALSQLSSKYNRDDTDRQYDICLKAERSSSKPVTIGTIYYHAKQAGIEFYSKQTKEIIKQAASQNRAGSDRKQIAKILHEHSGIAPELSQSIIDEVINKKVSYKSDNLIDDICSFLKPYRLKKNLITRSVELKGKPIDDSDINSIFLDTKVAFENVTKDLICSILFSNRIETYDPILTFFHGRGLKDAKDNCPNLTLLLESVISDTDNYDRWITKWLVSVVASAYKKHSPLVLVLCGEQQGTGKTHWFRYLLPQSLQFLFAESKMDNGKDDEILMTKKWIILDDEYGGKSKREEKKLKEITSKQWINVREPYGRVSVDLKRLAVFCGTSNEIQILNDPTGNRRIIPIHILDIDKQKYNECDKEMLWIELHALYQAGYDYTILSDDIINLNANTEDFKQSTAEEELVATKLSPEGVMPEWLNLTQIIQYLILDTKYSNLSNTRLGVILSKQGFEKKRMKMGGTVVTAYKINKITNESPSPFS